LTGLQDQWIKAIPQKPRGLFSQLVFFLSSSSGRALLTDPSYAHSAGGRGAAAAGCGPPPTSFGHGLRARA